VLIRSPWNPFDFSYENDRAGHYNEQASIIPLQVTVLTSCLPAIESHLQNMEISSLLGLVMDAGLYKLTLILGQLGEGFFYKLLDKLLF
jgi:hypothetical protein